MQFLSSLVVAAFAIFALFLLIGHRINLKDGKKVTFLLKKMDEKYEDFIQKRVMLYQLEEDTTFDHDQLTAEALKVLEPEIQGMAALAQTIKTPSLRYQSKYFQNVRSLADTYFQRQKEETPFTETDEHKFFAQTRSAIESDVRQRQLSLRIGGLG